MCVIGHLCIDLNGASFAKDGSEIVSEKDD